MVQFRTHVAINNVVVNILAYFSDTQYSTFDGKCPISN